MLISLLQMVRSAGDLRHMALEACSVLMRVPALVVAVNLLLGARVLLLMMSSRGIFIDQIPPAHRDMDLPMGVSHTSLTIAQETSRRITKRVIRGCATADS